MKNFFILFSLLYSFNLFSQQEKIFRIKKYKIATFSDSLNETSGLDFFKNHLLIFNDSGNSSEIFEIDKTSGKILKVISTNLLNTDWEAIAADGETIFIGDFGNNRGQRKDLKIYQIQTDDSLVVTKTEAINFFYPEQSDFSLGNRKTNFDAESMVFINGKIHLFTKEWEAKNTHHYVIDPNIKVNQAAEKIESFDVGFLVTDASYYDETLYLIGYTKKMEVFLMAFEENQNGHFFSGKPKKYYLGQTSSIGQIEGITVNKEGIYISGEEMNYKMFKAPQSFYFIPIDKLK